MLFVITHRVGIVNQWLLFVGYVFDDKKAHHLDFITKRGIVTRTLTYSVVWFG